MKDTELEWFRPLWLRVLVTALVAVWFAWEAFYTHDQLWMVVTGAALAYAVWNLFIKFPKDAPPKPQAGDDDGKPKS